MPKVYGSSLVCENLKNGYISAVSCGATLVVRELGPKCRMLSQPKVSLQKMACLPRNPTMVTF